MSEMEVAEIARDNGMHFFPPTLFPDLCAFANAVEMRAKDKERKRIISMVEHGLDQLKGEWDAKP